MKVLTDRNIERNAVTHRSVEKPRRVRWGDDDLELAVLERQASPPRGDEAFRAEQLPYLATVGELGRAGRVQLFSSFELGMEAMRQPGTDVGYLGLNLLEGITFSQVRSPIDRPVVISGFGQHVGLTEDEQMTFFHSIGDARFLEIRGAVGDAHVDDAFHLWSAEVAGLDAFLTMDRRFLNVMAQQGQRAKSPVSVWSPKDLCESLGEGPTDIETIAAKYPPSR